MAAIGTHARTSPLRPPPARLLDAAAVLRCVREHPDEGVALVARAQGGPVALWQLRLLGFTADMVSRRRRAGRFFVPLRGIYVPGYVGWGAGGQSVAALLSVGDGWLCGASACWWHGMFEHPPPVPHVLRVGGGRAQRSGVHQHRARVVDPRDVAIVRGVPLVSPGRALLELAATASPSLVEEALARGEVRRLVRREDLLEALPRWAHRPGARVLRAAVGDGRPLPTRSATERRFRRIWARVGTWPEYETNGYVCGRERDIVFRELRIVVEIDGREHFSEAGRQLDLRRDGELRAEGWDPVRFSGDRLQREPLAVAAELSAAIAIARRRLQDQTLAARTRAA